MSITLDDVRTLSFVEAELNYLVPMTGRPRIYTDTPPDGELASNMEHEAHRAAIHTLRGIRTTLDREGFELVQHRSRVSDFYDEAEIRGVYYPEVEQLLIDVTGAERVFIFDHTIRRRVPGAPDRAVAVPRQPVPRVHVDHTVRSGPQRVRDLIPKDAEALLRGRVEIINVWRPIRGPLLDAPLAVADARSVSPEDLVPSDLVYPHRVGETYQVTYNPAHRWFYAPSMQRDEALLIKCFDSKTDGRARFAPHTAFDDPTAPQNPPPRESIEIRTLVFHPA